MNYSNLQAPELFLKRPYNKAIDLWSYGILLLDLVQEETPYPKQKFKRKLDDLVILGPVINEKVCIFYFDNRVHSR